MERATALCFFEAARPERGTGPASETLESLATERPDLPWLTFYLGSLRWTRTSYAEGLYARAARVFARRGDFQGEILARTNRSRLLTESGRTAEAWEEVERVRELGEASGVPALLAWGQIVYARQLVDQREDLERAYEILHRVEVPGDAEDALSLHSERSLALGRACMAIGRFDEARELFRRLVDIAVAQEKRYLEATARYNLAWAGYESLREAPAASLRAETVDLARRAMELARETEHDEVEALAAGLLGELTPGEAGIEYLARCHRVAKSPRLRSFCLNPWAHRVAASDPGAAREMLRRSRELAQESGDPWAEVRVRQREMQVAWTIEPPREALRTSWRALDAVEALRSGQADGSLGQAGLFSVWSDDYAWLAGSAARAAGEGLDREVALAAAFEAAERLRARALADWLRRSDPHTGRGTGHDSPGLSEARAALEPGEALLSFQIAPWEDLTGDFAGGSWLLAITRDAVTAHPLPGRVEVRNKVRQLEAAIAGRSGSPGRETTGTVLLYQDLLAPALARLPADVDRLILIPDDALHRLPFAALRASESAEPVGARYELVQVPSAALWLRWRRAQPPAATRPLLVLADPESPPGAAEPGGAVRTAANGTSAPSRARPLEHLPYARREGKAAIRALGDGVLLTGVEASEAAIGRIELHDFGLVHFATHADTDEARPELSAVRLAPAGGAGGGDDPRSDGYLRSAEIARLDLTGCTVVLASCRSADGSMLRGEGVMSLARAFFQAEAHGVVASLWRLRDDESAAMFERFYRHLGRGATVAAALHEARREAIAAGEPVAAWAGLVVLGDGGRAPVPGGRRGSRDPGARWWSGGIGLIVVLAGVAGALAVRRFRPR